MNDRIFIRGLSLHAYHGVVPYEGRVGQTFTIDMVLDIAAKAGIARDQIVLDPGIGFGKTPEQSVETLRRYDEIDWAGFPVLVGASRKRFIASVVPSPPDKRIGGSLAAHLHAAQKGAAIIRAHDVAETIQALRIAAAIGAIGASQ